MSAKTGMRCSVKGCTNKASSQVHSFFGYPKEVDRRAIWMKNCGTEDLANDLSKSNRCHRVCGAHFEDKMFLNSTTKSRLVFNAIPTLVNSTVTLPRIVSNASLPSSKSLLSPPLTNSILMSANYVDIDLFVDCRTSSNLSIENTVEENNNLDTHRSILNEKPLILTVFDHTYCKNIPEVPKAIPIDIPYSAVDNYDANIISCAPIADISDEQENHKSRDSTSFLTTTPDIIIPCSNTLFPVICEEKTIPREKPQLIPFQPRKRKHYVGDFDINDIERPDERLQFWHAAQNTVISNEHKVKELRNTNYQLRQQITNFDLMVDRLRSENKMSEDCFKLLKNVISKRNS